MDEESWICDDSIPTFGSDLILPEIDQIGTAFNGDRRTALAHLATVQLGIQRVLVEAVVVVIASIVTGGVTATKYSLIYLMNRDGARHGETVRTSQKSSSNFFFTTNRKLQFKVFQSCRWC